MTCPACACACVCVWGRCQVHTYAAAAITNLLTAKDGTVPRVDKDALAPVVETLLQKLFAGNDFIWQIRSIHLHL